VSALSGFLLVLLGFGFLIFIHELGHFLAAKWAGIRADGFAIGMGPCLASYRRGVGFCLGSADAKVVRLHGRRPIEMRDGDREGLGIGETEYSLRALPLGGYVRMLGQEDGNPGATSDDARSFGKATIPRRAVVILAGITANLALAVVLFLVSFLAGVRFPAPTIGFVVPGSPAALAEPLTAGAAVGIQPGDRVVTVDGAETRTFIDLRVAAAMAKPDTALLIEVEREGRRLQYSAMPIRDEASGLLSIGVDAARSSALTDVRDSREDVARMLSRNAIAPDSGIGPGSRITAIDGARVATFAEVSRAARAARGDSVEVQWSTPRQDVGGSGARSAELATRLALRPDFGVVRLPENGGSDAALIGLAPLPRVLELAPESANREVLRAGDVFLRVGSLAGPRIPQLMAHLRGNPSQVIAARVLRDGSEIDVDIRTDRDGRVGVYLEPAWDLPLLAQSIDRIMVANETVDTPARALATTPLASVTSVDGAIIGSLTALRARLVDIARATQPGSGASVRIGIRDAAPGATPQEVAVPLGTADLEALRELGLSFPIPESYFDPEFTVLSANGNPFTAVAMGFRQTVVMVEQVFLTIDRVARGSVGAEQLQGPVGILHTGTKVADEGFMYIVFFLALISVNLAVVNLLPIPIADGGLFVFLMYERVTGRPPSIAFQNAAALAGIAFVIALFLFTFYNDIMRLLGV
jgi:regulator of sigma E protease